MPFPSKQKKLYEQLLEELQRYPAGSKLPPERILAQQFGVARMTLREPLDRLVREHRIIRKRAGTFILDPESGELPSAPQKNKNIHILLPCPDYSVSSGYFSYLVTTECIRGAMKAAVRYGSQVITIPVSQTNEQEKIDWNQLSLLKRDNIVLFAGDWYKKLLPVLIERGCRVGAILPQMEENLEDLLQDGEDYLIFKRPMLANYLPEVLSDLKEKGCRNPLLFTRKNFSMLFPHPEWNLTDHLEEIRKSFSPGKLQFHACEEQTSFVEQCAKVWEIFEKEPFDALIFDSASELGQAVNLRKLCNLPEDLPIYVRGRDLLGGNTDSRKNLYYSRSGFLECSHDLAEQLLSGELPEKKIFDFKHFIYDGESAWKDNQI
ncbi:MAG: GntR family transcriptional regulator [Lentisphaeria bacterium]|nr:GntR family transcriptional regulator [Lentisphaeria bacterium]